MKNIKFIAICAASGFVLSLICGFFSKSGFGRIFLIALIFGILFGGLSFGISVIFDKFLATDSSVGEVSVSLDGSIASGNSEKKVLGQHVDLIIQEEPLEQTGNENHYDVGENHQMLNESDYNNSNEKKEDEKTEDIVPKNEFVPIRNLETVNNLSGSEAQTPAEAEHRREAIAAQNEKKGEDLDVLPDMSEFKVASGNESGEDDDTVVLSDADDASFVSSVTGGKNSDFNDGEIKDASLMAKAISSILSEET